MPRDVFSAQSSGSSSQSVMHNTGFHCRTRQNWNKCRRPSRSVPPLTERPETAAETAAALEAALDVVDAVDCVVGNLPLHKLITDNSQRNSMKVLDIDRKKKRTLPVWSSMVQYGIRRLLTNLSMPGLFEVRLILRSHHEEGKHRSETNSKAQHCESLTRTKMAVNVSLSQNRPCRSMQTILRTARFLDMVI